VVEHALHLDPVVYLREIRPRLAVVLRDCHLQAVALFGILPLLGLPCGGEFTLRRGGFTLRGVFGDCHLQAVALFGILPLLGLLCGGGFTLKGGGFTLIGGGFTLRGVFGDCHLQDVALFKNPPAAWFDPK
jgi:hypothetical protein